MNAIYVSAGKYEPDGSKNYKYCSPPFASWDEAISHVLNGDLQLYSFCELDFHTDGFVRTLDFAEFMRPQDYRRRSHG